MPDSPDIHAIQVDANGLSFNVATCGDGEQLALCLHGFPETSFAFRHQLRMFARLGYRAWAPDLRGYGLSSRPRGVFAYTIDKLQADVAGLIDAAGAKRVVLVGHDWGGGIAWNFAINHVRPLERLIVLNSPHPLCLVRGMLRPSQLRRLWYMFYFQLPWLPELTLRANDGAAIGRAFTSTTTAPARFPPEVTRLYRDAALQPGALTAMLNYYRAMPLAFAQNDPRKLSHLDTPTLMLWGEADDVLTRSLAEGTERYVEKLTLRYLPGVSHWIQEEAPDEVNAQIEAWLAQTV
jgi:pimeloyl-ACP methyl ester carboxylesterase